MVMIRDDVRVKILDMLKHGPVWSTQIHGTNIAPHATVRRHMQKLRYQKLIHICEYKKGRGNQIALYKLGEGVEPPRHPKSTKKDIYIAYAIKRDADPVRRKEYCEKRKMQNRVKKYASQVPREYPKDTIDPCTFWMRKK